MLITLVLLLSTGSLLRVESHQSSSKPPLPSSSPSSSSPSLNRQYHQSISSHHYSNGGLGHGRSTSISRRKFQRKPPQPFHHQHQHQKHQQSGPSPRFLSNSKPSASSLVRRFWPNSPQSNSPSPSSYVNSIPNAIGTNLHVNSNFNSLLGPLLTAESIIEAIEELPRTYYYRDTAEPKGYHHGPSGKSLTSSSSSSSSSTSSASDYLQASSSIRENSFASSPFTVNEHVPVSPVHNGWIPKNSKHWSPGAYRSAFYTPDTRLIKFTIHDRVSGSAKQSASPSIAIGTYVHPSLSVNPVKSKIINSNNNNNNQFNVNSVNSNINSNHYQPTINRNSVSSKYGADFFNHPSLIEESYNINDDELIKTTTVSPTTTITTTTTPSSQPSTINKASIVVTVTSSPPPSSTSTTSQHDDKSTESSTSITTIKPSTTIAG